MSFLMRAYFSPYHKYHVLSRACEIKKDSKWRPCLMFSTLSLTMPTECGLNLQLWSDVSCSLISYTTQQYFFFDSPSSQNLFAALHYFPHVKILQGPSKMSFHLSISPVSYELPFLWKVIFVITAPMFQFICAFVAFATCIFVLRISVYVL